MNKTTWKEFSERYCKTQVEVPTNLAIRLKEQIKRYSPVGFILAEAQLMDSSYFGSVVILPYGPNNTFKEIPTHPFSPRGLASDTSVVIMHITVDEVPST